ncbi:hypothetical protein D307_gp131 [Bacillus phage Bastille]|uniref:Uncharacterized protein n=1 Tax=Bacillus phage Bastille TaxID=57477 RepID=J9PL07_9CAUD|nr:hypothetical protein D307_gp131 [Bacillus phage Bastille]AEQ34333.1 hypothetical protein [Bacillus phage Bastille]
MTTEKSTETVNSGLAQLDSLIQNEERKIIGVTYTNDFFSSNPLARAHVMNDRLQVTEDSLEIGFFMRLEYNTLPELESTLEVLALNDAGDVMGYIADGEVWDKPNLEERITENYSLFTADVFLKMKQPSVTFEEIEILNKVYTLAAVTHKIVLDEDAFFEQTIKLLFGYEGQLTILSDFANREASIILGTEMQKVIKLLENDNVLGKAITGAVYHHAYGHSVVSTNNEMIKILSTPSGIYLTGDESEIFVANRFFDCAHASVDLHDTDKTRSISFNGASDDTLEIFIEI